MFNKTLHRPMFRRGGRAGGGIMTGVERQGYQGTGDAKDQNVKESVTKDIPKGMIKVFDKTLIERQIEIYHNCGIEDITIVISKPLILSILSKLTSGNIICSLMPSV